MTTPVTNPTNIQRLTEAGDWLLRINDEARSEEDIAGWLRWCEAHPDNLAAFEAVQRDWQDLDALKPIRTSSSLSSATRWKIAASLVLTTAAAILAINYWPARPQHQVAAATTNKSATLPDGSAIVLSARTQVDINFTEAGRRLDLSQGEAYFKVQRDQLRPFIVHAGEVDVTAIGTAFNIRRDNDRVVVTVEEGVVEVFSPLADSEQRRAWRTEAGYQFIYSARGRNTSLASVDPANVLKWRTGELSYVWQPLSEVISDVNRYSQRRIIIGSPELADLHFTGTVFTSSIDDWLKAIEDAYPVTIQTTPAGDLVVVPSAGSASVQKSTPHSLRMPTDP